MKKWMGVSLACALMVVAAACSRQPAGGPETPEEAKANVQQVREQMRQIQQNMMRNGPQRQAPNQQPR